MSLRTKPLASILVVFMATLMTFVLLFGRFASAVTPLPHGESHSHHYDEHESDHDHEDEAADAEKDTHNHTHTHADGTTHSHPHHHVVKIAGEQLFSLSSQWLLPSSFAFSRKIYFFPSSQAIAHGFLGELLRPPILA